MPERPRSHELEKISRNRLHHIFTQVGWVVWDLQPDYGEDLFIRIFVNSKATHYSFFVQAKATDHIDSYLLKDGKSLSFRMKTDHIGLWGQFWEPVFLMIYDAKSEIIYWEIIQDYLQENHIATSQRKSVVVHVPLTNVLDEAGIESILTRTKSRFERFEDIRAGVGAITDYLEEEINVKVGYDPTCQFLSFDYYSKETGKLLRWDVVLLGTLVDKLTELAKIMNKDPEQLFLEIMEEKFGRGDNAET